ncbi:Penicillin-binding protein 1C, partial [Irineochytrium annulatum]
MTVGVVVDGEVAWTRAFGDASSTGTLFQIGSNSKAFAPFAVAQVVADGDLSWEAPVTTLAASGVKSFKDPVAGAIMNLKDCLSHRSGMGVHPYMEAFEDRARWIPELGFSKPIRDAFEYNNMMVALAADIAANASGLGGWNELVSKKIFEPAGMERSWGHPLAVPQGEDVAVGYAGRSSVDGEDAVPLEMNEVLKFAGGAGGIVSNVDDMLKWMKLSLDEGTTSDGTSLLSPEFFAELVKRSFASYGLGWSLGLYKNEKTYQHSGGSFGFTSHVALFPDRKGGVVVLTSSADEGALPVMAARAIIDGYRIFYITPHAPHVNDRSCSVFFPNDAPVDWAAAIATATFTSHATRQARIEADDLLLDRSNATSLPLESYVGVYTNPGYGRLSVSLPDSPAK